jgi:hypothetical protein
MLPKNTKIKVYRTVILCGCETLSRASSEEHRLRVLKNRVLMKIFRPKWEEVTADWKKLHTDKLHGPYSLSNNIRMTEQRVIM